MSTSNRCWFSAVNSIASSDEECEHDTEGDSSQHAGTPWRQGLKRRESSTRSRGAAERRQS